MPKEGDDEKSEFLSLISSKKKLDKKGESKFFELLEKIKWNNLQR